MACPHSGNKTYIIKKRAARKNRAALKKLKVLKKATAP
jgi:hypothetical protein